MLAVLNISLDEKIPGHDAAEKMALILMRAHHVFGPTCGEMQQVQYDGPDGPVEEHCAVLVIGSEAKELTLENAIHMMAMGFGQDCIAVVYHDGRGKTIGPGAERWPFDRRYFNMPAAFKAHQNADAI